MAIGSGSAEAVDSIELIDGLGSAVLIISSSIVLIGTNNIDILFEAVALSTVDADSK